jgi:hypothetical protein
MIVLANCKLRYVGHLIEVVLTFVTANEILVQP